VAFKVKPFREVLALTKEKLDEALAPIRAKSAKAKADLEVATLQEKLIDLETKIHTKCAERELNFGAIAELIDEYELLERRLKQIERLVDELFPTTE
jgi:hypothetical protein